MDEAKTPLWIKDFESTYVAQRRHKTIKRIEYAIMIFIGFGLAWLCQLIGVL